MNLLAGLFDDYSLIAGQFYPKAISTKMIAGLFDAYSLHEIETCKPSSSVVSASTGGIFVLQCSPEQKILVLVGRETKKSRDSRFLSVV